MSEKPTTDDEKTEQVYRRVLAMIDDEWRAAGVAEHDLQRSRDAARALASSPPVVTALARHEGSRDAAPTITRQWPEPREPEACKVLLHLIIDVQAAIEAAYQRGSISNLHRLILYLFYWHQFTLAEIADALGAGEAAMTRGLHQALEGIKETGLLEGYGELEEALASFRSGSGT